MYRQNNFLILHVIIHTYRVCALIHMHICFSSVLHVHASGSKSPTHPPLCTTHLPKHKRICARARTCPRITHARSYTRNTLTHPLMTYNAHTHTRVHTHTHTHTHIHHTHSDLNFIDEFSRMRKKL